MIIINFKNYRIGPAVLDLVRKIDIYCNKAILAVPLLEMKEIVKETTLPIYAQHVDYFEPGKSTGYIIPEAIKQAGAQGAIINHSEHRLTFSEIKKTVERCRELELKTIICTSTLKQTEQIKKLNPYAIAFEDPKLIGTGKSITMQKANMVQKFVKILEGTNIIPLCGAGITSGDDVAQALILGCKGVLVSSVVANSQNPERFLKEIGNLF
jgi:triosephosphate isomerase